MRQEVAAFSNDLRRVGAAGTAAGGAVAGIGENGLRAGQVSLEFYQKKRRWPFAPENIPWEVWTIRTDLVHFANEHERQNWQEKVGEMLADKVMYIAEVTNFESQQLTLKRRMTYWRSDYIVRFNLTFLLLTLDQTVSALISSVPVGDEPSRLRPQDAESSRAGARVRYFLP